MSSNSHEGVSCDLCMKSNFTGKRYKCLICYDFDLCSACHDQAAASNTTTTTGSLLSSSSKPSSTSAKPPPQKQLPPTPNIPLRNNNHSNTHPMQCILTKSDFELFYGSNVVDFIEQSSFTCPHCGKLGFSEATLCEHLSVNHANNNNNLQEVVCPICAALPSGSGGDPNHLTEDLLQHINVEHLNNGGRGAFDENSADVAAAAAVVNSLGTANLINSSNFGSTASAVAAAAALRFSRRLNYSQNTMRASGGSGSSARNLIGNTLTSSGGGGSAAGRYAYQFGNGSGGSGLSSFMRSTSAGLESMLSSASNSSMDPIAELLSQLTGVRRATAVSQSTNLQLQQLQAQLNRERENLQNQSASIAAATGGGSGSRHHHHTLGHHLFSASGGGGSSSNKLNPFNSIRNMSGTGGQSVSAAQASNAAAAAASQTQSNLTQAMTNESLELPQNLFLQPMTNNCRDSRYLLTKYDFSNVDIQFNSKTNVINQSMFINDIILSLLMQQLNETNASNDTVFLAKQDSNNDFQSDDAFEQTPLTTQEMQNNFEAFNLMVTPK